MAIFKNQGRCAAPQNTHQRWYHKTEARSKSKLTHVVPTPDAAGGGAGGGGAGGSAAAAALWDAPPAVEEGKDAPSTKW